MSLAATSEVIQKKKISYDSTYTWNLIFKTTQMNLFTKQKHIHIENKPMVIKGKVGEEGRDK